MGKVGWVMYAAVGPTGWCTSTPNTSRTRRRRIAASLNCRSTMFSTSVLLEHQVVGLTQAAMCHGDFYTFETDTAKRDAAACLLRPRTRSGFAAWPKTSCSFELERIETFVLFTCTSVFANGSREENGGTRRARIRLSVEILHCCLRLQ